MKATKNPLDLKSHTERMVQNPNSESSDSRRPLLALMNCIYELQKKDVHNLVNFLHDNSVSIRESVDSLCRDGADAQYMQYLSKSRITSPQIR